MKKPVSILFILAGIVCLSLKAIHSPQIAQINTGKKLYQPVPSVKSVAYKRWGFFGHRQINRTSVFTLPPEMVGFYKHHIEFITTHAVDPDNRRNVVAAEAARHYIDIDHYAKGGADAFAVVPNRWKAAVEKFTQDTLQAYGIVPWHIEIMVYRLINAFKEKDVEKILRTSADLGHYVGDAHVPLHTTENYNGQLTGQKGIHAFWESRLPELFSTEYNFFVGKATYIKDVNAFAWSAVRESHGEVDSVLQLEKQLSQDFDPDKKYTYEHRGSAMVQVYSQEYSRQYSLLLHNMVERRMRKAILAVGCLWYTAWVDAGQPDLNRLILQGDQPDALENDSQIDSAYKNRTVRGRNCEE